MDAHYQQWFYMLHVTGVKLGSVLMGFPPAQYRELDTAPMPH